ncbi:MAG: GlsB/YeaQ/YmgE family stress response membrane protein [Sedimentisphaerales bacterium]|nr:GlsB/YeaQ/YmgE family stress response membrane protein [Sedimentisphaerales bacterium]
MKLITSLFYDMGILLWIIFGGIVGWIASMLMGTNAQMGILLNVIVGVIGATLGGWIFSMLGETGVTGFNIWSLMVAVIGAVVLLGLVRLIRGR